jgi:hypothetical protein
MNFSTVKFIWFASPVICTFVNDFGSLTGCFDAYISVSFSNKSAVSAIVHEITLYILGLP